MKKTKDDSKWRLILAVVILIIFMVAAGLIRLTNGKTTITSGENNNEEVSTLTCESNEIAYPFFTYDDSEAKELKINAVFKDDVLDSISLVYALTYANEDEAKKSELKNHIDFEVGIQDEGIRREDLNSDHQIMDNVYQLSMYNSGNDMSNKIAKYYLIDFLSEDYTQAKVSKSIVGHGLDCVNKYKEVK